MPTSAVLIVANPFEARMVSRAVEGAGLRPVISEGGEGALEKFKAEDPMAVVLAQGLYYADEGELLASLRAHRRAAPVLLIRDGRVSDPRLIADGELGRPISPTQLLEKLAAVTGPRRGTPVAVLAVLAVQAAQAKTGAADEEPWWEETPPPVDLSATVVDLDVTAETIGAAPPGEQTVEIDAWWDDEITPPPEAVPSLSEAIPGAAAASSADTAPAGGAPQLAVQSRTHRPALLRMDDALNDSLLSVRSPGRRSLDAHLAAVERKLFGHAPAATGDASFDDFHLGLDTLPGFDAELGLTDGAVPRALKNDGLTGGKSDNKSGRIALGSTGLSARPPAGNGTVTGGKGDDGAVPRAIESGNGTGSLRHKNASLDAALARIVPGREAQLSKGTVTSSLATPELDENVGIADFPDAGDLADVSLPSLLVRLQRAGYAGRLSIRRGEGEKSIYFDGGFPVHATSNLPHDRLGELLWREGKITRDQHARSRTLADKTGRRIVDCLVDINALKRDELFKVLRHYAEEIIYSCFGWDRGAWSLGREVASRDERVSIAHPYAIALEGIRRKYGLERLVQAVGAASTSYAAAPSLWAISADAQLSTSEKDAIQSLRRGARTVSELQAAGRLDQIGVYALVHGLLLLGGLQPGTGDESETSDGGGALVDRERAQAKHAQVLEGDYFAILGVGRGASTYEIRRAWERMRQDFAPERFDRGVQADLGAAIGEILEVVDEAHRALADESLRETYRAHLVE